MKYCKGDKSRKCSCLVCIEFFPLILEFLCILIDFPVQIATIRMGLSIRASVRRVYAVYYVPKSAAYAKITHQRRTVDF